MRKVLWASGAIAVLLLAFLLTGMAEPGDAVNKALLEGNERYELAEYDEALGFYEAGLGISPENKALNFNAGQAAYALEEYEKAIAYYGQSEDSADVYLNAGNASFRLGEKASEMDQKMPHYLQALETYQDGITKYPQDVPLKYNYETVKEKIDEMLSDMEQESESQDNGQGDDQSEGDENQENQGPGGQDGQNQDESDGQQNQDQESQDQESQDERPDGSQEEQDSQQNEQQNQQQNEGQNNNTQEGQEGQGEAQDKSGDQPASHAQEEAGGQRDQEEIARILAILEGQEEEGLKNNQEVVGGKGGSYGW